MNGADAVRSGVRVVGELLVTAGVVLLLFAAHLLWGTNVRTAAAQEDLRDQLRSQWAAAGTASRPGGAPARDVALSERDDDAVPPPARPQAAEPLAPPLAPPLEIGDGFAIIRFPTLGDDRGVVVVEGVTTAALKQGPGHYPGTAAPGELGNVVVSGHRTTYGAPFGAIGELAAGDEIELETATAVHRYRVEALEIVPPTAIEVTYPVPGRPGVAPERRLLTLTTCHPRYSARERLIVTAELAETTPRAVA